jgi:hypothetical protein
MNAGAAAVRHAAVAAIATVRRKRLTTYLRVNISAGEPPHE